MSPQEEVPRDLAYQTTLVGPVRVPGSKSIAQRALLLAALAPGETRLDGDFSSVDVKHVLKALRELGIELQSGPRKGIAILGGQAVPPAIAVDVGESGTAGRLWAALIGLGAFGSGSRQILAQGSLCGRRSGALLEALSGAGVGVLVADPERGDFPLSLRPLAAGGLKQLALLHPESSQEVTGLLLGLAGRDDRQPLRVTGEIPSEPYVRLTVGVMQHFGVATTWDREGEGSTFVLRGELRAPQEVLHIEPDASAAAVALAAGCLSGSGASVCGLSEDSLQGDVAIVRYLRCFGSEAGFDASGVWARGMPGRGAEIDLGSEPDLAPVLAAVAAAAAWSGGGASRLTGLGTLPGKESDRLSVLEAGLRQLGFEAECGPNELRIARGAPHGEARILDPKGDHRMAFAFALLSLFLKGVQVSGPDCVAKSWPSFWDDLAP